MKISIRDQQRGVVFIELALSLPVLLLFLFFLRDFAMLSKIRSQMVGFAQYASRMTWECSVASGVALPDYDEGAKEDLASCLVQLVDDLQTNLIAEIECEIVVSSYFQDQLTGDIDSLQAVTLIDVDSRFDVARVEQDDTLNRIATEDMLSIAEVFCQFDGLLLGAIRAYDTAIM